MATKKQKRQAAIDKHNREMEEYRRSGLESLQKDREYRAHKAREEWRDNHNKRHSWKKRIKECPICQDEIREARKNSLPEKGKDEPKDTPKPDLSKPQTGPFPDVDYGPTEDIDLTRRVNA